MKTVVAIVKTKTRLGGNFPLLCAGCQCEFHQNNIVVTDYRRTRTHRERYEYGNLAPVVRVCIDCRVGGVN